MSSSGRTEPPGDAGSAEPGNRPAPADEPSGRRGAAIPGRRLAGRLARLVFSGDTPTALHIRFGFAAGLGHLAWALTYAFTAGQQQMGHGAMQVMVVTNLIGLFGFYPFVRLGWTRGVRESGLVLPQMLWGSFSAVLGFALAPPLRLALLQMLCLIPMYGFFYLKPRQLALAGGGAASMLTAALAFGACGHLPRFDVHREIYPSLLSALVLIGITGITMDHSARRGQMRRQKLELNAAVAAVRDLVVRDTLTGLFNRRHMQDLLQEERARALHTGRPFAVALLDLDHFKRINDTHGHGTGDDVLHRFAALAALSMRETDTVARWGGEEFLVLMTETAAPREARAPLDRLRWELERQDTESLLARIGLTFSAGLAFHRIDETVEQVVARADRALYAAKDAGRNRLSVDDESMAEGLPA